MAGRGDLLGFPASCLRVCAVGLFFKKNLIILENIINVETFYFKISSYYRSFIKNRTCKFLNNQNMKEIK